MGCYISPLLLGRRGYPWVIDNAGQTTEVRSVISELSLRGVFDEAIPLLRLLRLLRSARNDAKTNHRGTENGIIFAHILS